MQNPLRDENPVVGSNPAPPNNRVTKKATKHRAGKSNPVQNVPPPPPPEDAVPSNGVEFDEEEEPSEVNRDQKVLNILDYSFLLFQSSVGQKSFCSTTPNGRMFASRASRC